MNKKFFALSLLAVAVVAAAVWSHYEKSAGPESSAPVASAPPVANPSGLSHPALAAPLPAGTATAGAARTGSAATAPAAPARLSPAVVFGAIGPVTLQEIPAGRFHDQVAKLSPAARAKVLKHLGDAHVPLIDVQSLSADRDGMLFYACAFEPVAAGAQPIIDRAAIQAAARAEGLAEASVPISSPPIRHSKPGATNVIYLDFNGYTITGTAWNTGGNTLVAKPYDKDGDPTTFNDAEQLDIIRVWERVAEDYRPFNVDVTTEQPAVFTATTGRILITPSVDANGQLMPSNTAGGVAYVGVFGSSNYPTFYSPALVYCDHLGPNNEGYIAEAASHEMGHNMGLSHDGLTTGAAYYGGHGSGETSWGPIMGTGYNRNVSQWSKGEYYNANNTEDDLAIIAGRLGYQTDDYGDTNATAAPVTVTGNTISASGIISQTGEADRFSFSTGAGSVTITASPFRSAVDTYGGNLDIQLELIDSTNTVLTTANPPATTGASITTTLAPGTYYVRVTGVGVGSPMSSTPDGYTSYASLGAYTLSGTITVASFNKLSAGRYHSLRLNSSSLLYATGTNTYGQLGTGNTTTFNTPQLVTLPAETVTDLAAGGQHSLFLTSVKDLWATGINDNGQLGDGTVVAKSTPIKIATNVAGMAASVFHSAYLKTDGTLWTMGLNDEGQLGTGETPLPAPDHHTAVQIATNVVDLAAGNRQTLFVKSDGTLWGAGDLYNNGTLTSTPIQLATGVKTVAAGGYHCLILKTDGTLWTLGFNAYGQLGTSDTTTRTAPVQIATGVKAIAAGYFHSAFIKTDNTLWTFGYNSFGQIGDGSTNPRLAPYQLATGVAAVSASESYTLFLKTDGSLWGTGLNGNGQFGNGLNTTVSSPVQISVGSIAAPAAPSGLTVSANGALDRLNLTWQPAGSATGYEIWRSTSYSFGSATRIAQNVRWAFYQDLTASPNTTYYYWITAVNPAGTSSPGTSQSGGLGTPRATASDFNRDGRADILWENTSTGDRGFWLMNGTAFASWIDVGVLTTDLRIAATADFNGDGKTDIVWENTVTGKRVIWLMNDTTFSSSVSLGIVSTDWRIVAAADFNGDGKPDLLWENTVTGDRYFWLMNGTSLSSAVFLCNISTNWHIAGTGDFDGDGKPDIVWENTATGERYLWLMNGTTYASGISLGVVSTDWRIAAIADYNGDGKPDIVWENTVTGDRGFWLMNGPTLLSWVDLGITPTAWRIGN